MATDDDHDHPEPPAEPRVKQLLDGSVDPMQLEEVVDPATAAELAKWFGLPSFEQLASPPAAAPDAEDVAWRERRASVLAAIDPALVEAHRLRVEHHLASRSTIELHVDPSIPLLDVGMLERGKMFADSRELERPPGLEDDLRQCAPQALLRDLHRPELAFAKQFELSDPLGEQRVDVAATIAEVMATTWKLPAGELTPTQEARALWGQARQLRKSPWVPLIAAAELPNRRVKE